MLFFSLILTTAKGRAPQFLSKHGIRSGLHIIVTVNITSHIPRC